MDTHRSTHCRVDVLAVHYRSTRCRIDVLAVHYRSTRCRVDVLAVLKKVNAKILKSKKIMCELTVVSSKPNPR